MSIQVQIRQGLASENATFVGAEGELVYTTDTKDLFVHDGSNAGGTPVGSLASIADDSVTFAKIEEIPANTILGNNTGSSSDILELSVAQTQALLNVADGATANDSDANLKSRANHTGTQTASTISDFNTAASTAAPVQTSDIANFETTTELNTRDTNNRSRTNHTGTQTASTISDFDTEVANNSAVAANTAKISYTDAAAVALNTAKVTNATHTGDVTGATALTIANGVVDSDKLSTTLDFGSIA
jgi:hypothetical protein